MFMMGLCFTIINYYSAKNLHRVRNFTQGFPALANVYTSLRLHG